MAREDPQINVRLPPNRRAILEAAVFVNDKGTPSKLVREIVEDAIDQYAKSPAVKKALDARVEQKAANEGKLAHLAGRRARSGADTRGKSSP